MFDAWFHVDGATGRPAYASRNPLLYEDVCRYGRGSNQMRCGYVTAENVAVYTTDAGGVSTLVGNQAIVNVPSTYGDSGGPVWGAYTAMGVIGATNPTSTYFTIIGAAGMYTGTRVCFDPVCS